MSNTPQIRFAGFTDAWEQRKLGSIADKVTEKNGQLSYSETFTNSAEFGIISQRDFFDHDISNSENIGGYYVVRDNDFVYNPRISVTAPCGPINCNRLGRNGVMSPLYTVFKAHDIDTLYLEWFFKSSYWHSFMYYNGDSGARSDRFSIKNDLFFMMPIPVPTEEEQRRIGSLLSTLDKAITLHQRECDALQKFKKSMLQKMFPQNGESVPEIRFAGFTDAWEQRKFSDFTFPAGEKNKNDLPLEPYAITNEHGFIAQSEAHDDFGYMQDVDRKMYIIVKPNSFAYNPARINVGSLGYYEGTKNVIVSSLYEVFQTVDDVDDIFLNQWFKTKDFMDWIAKLQEGSVRQYFYYDKLCECKMCMPSVEEQQQIGTYFRNLDTLITLHQRKLETLQKMKKSLLQKMFV